MAGWGYHSFESNRVEPCLQWASELAFDNLPTFSAVPFG
jgi:hypothetical protein